MDEQTAQHHALSDNEFVTVDYVCKLFGLARVTVIEWLNAGELPHYRLGPRTIRIARADLERFLEERRRIGAIDGPTSAEEVDIRSRCSAPGEEVPTREAAA